jgi:hypothetical protein
MNQVRFDWICSILSQTGMNLDNCFPESGNYQDQTIEQKAQLRNNLNDNNILIIDNNDNSIIVYIQDQIIAEFKKPLYIRREDLSEINPKKRIYIEINIECNSVFDEEMSS